MSAINTPARRASQRKVRLIKRNWQLYLFLLPAVVIFLLFHYYPMYGVQIAFKDFRANLGIAGSPWVGLKHFKRFVTTSSFTLLMGNTLRISLMSLLIGFPMPVLFALLINEIRYTPYRKMIQTVSYAPHFISTVVMVSMLTIFLDKDYGIVNVLIGTLGIGPYDFIDVYKRQRVHRPFLYAHHSTSRSYPSSFFSNCLCLELRGEKRKMQKTLAIWVKYGYNQRVMMEKAVSRKTSESAPTG